MTSRACHAVSIIALLVLVSCASRSAPEVTRAAIEPLDLYPFRAGNAWSYDVDTGESTTTLAITRVEAFDGKVADVRTAEAIVRYEALPEGIRVQAQDAWLVRAPLSEGSTWPAPGGRAAELVSTSVSAETPAGVFRDCIEVLETGGPLELEVRTVYCPGVGPVSVTSTMRSDTSDRALTVSARLRGYDVTSSAAPDR